jgi:hypothetical protein
MQESIPYNLITGAEALFGTDPTERIVAVEPDPQEGAWRYRRKADGVIRERVPYRPWILLTERPEIPLIGAQFTELEGRDFAFWRNFRTWRPIRRRVFAFETSICPTSPIPAAQRWRCCAPDRRSSKA